MLLARPTPHGPPLRDGCRHSSAVGLPTFFPSSSPPSLPLSLRPPPCPARGGRQEAATALIGFGKFLHVGPTQGARKIQVSPCLAPCAELRRCPRIEPGASDGAGWAGWAQEVDIALPGGGHPDPARLPVPSHPGSAQVWSPRVQGARGAVWASCTPAQAWPLDVTPGMSQSPQPHQPGLS